MAANNRRSSQFAPPSSTLQEEKKSDNAADVNKTDGILPQSYQNALASLAATATDVTRPPSLPSLSDSDVLDLAKELLSTLHSTKDDWTVASDWPRREADLLRVDGRARDGLMSQSTYQLGDAVGTYLATYIDALEHKLAGEGKVPSLLQKKRTAGGNDEHTVYGPAPMGATLPGNTFEVWASTLADGAGADSSGEGVSNKVTVVLGAGNQSMLTIVDVVHNVLTRRSPVLVKHHPLRPWLSDAYAVVLAPLLERGYYAQVPDVDVPVTTALLERDVVGHVHITGSLATANAVKDTLRRTRPTLTDADINGMVTSELGCCTPWIVNPGRYTDVELTHVARMLVAGKKANGGCNCLSAQALVLPKAWEQKDALRAKVLEELERQPTFPCYYPGSRERRVEMERACRDAGSTCTAVEASSVSEGTKVDEKDQVVVVECGTPGEEGYNSIPLLREAFGPVLAIVELDGAADDDYLSAVAVPFVNDKSNIFGSLSCSLVTPGSRASQNLEPAIAALNYGCIAVNQWNAFGYSTAMRGGVWAGHPSETLGQSGAGHIGNQYDIPGVAKSVVYGPPLENKPIFDLAKPPPAIVMDVMRELTCSSSATAGAARVFTMLIVRMARTALGWVPGMGSLIGTP